MALHEVYLDESYSDTDPIFAVGGYLMRAETAKLLDGDWREVLARFRVPYFHMADIAACNKDHCHEIYQHLGPTGCDQLAREMIGLIGKHETYGMAALTNTRMCSADPFAYCLLECLIGLGAWLAENDPTGKVAYVFEAGHKTGPKAHQVILSGLPGTERTFQDIFSGLTFKRKEELPLLQAADLLVWQARKFLNDFLNNARPPRKDFVTLIESRLHVIAFKVTEDWNIQVDRKTFNHLDSTKPHIHVFADEQFAKCLRAMFSDIRNPALFTTGIEFHAEFPWPNLRRPVWSSWK